MWDFIKNATVDSLDSVPEQFRTLYEEKEGKFTISAGAKGIVDAYNGQTAALTKSRADLKKANDESASRRVTQKAVADKLAELGIEVADAEDPLASLGAFVTDLQTKGKGGNELKVNMEKVKADADRRVAEVTASADAKNTAMQRTLEKHLIGREAATALAKHKGNPDLLLDKIIGRAKVVQEGEEFVVRVVDEAGDFRTNGAGGFLDIDGLVQDYKRAPTYAVAFASEAKGGNDTNAQGQQRRHQTQVQSGDKSSVDKIASGLGKQQHERGRAAADA